MTIRLKLNRLPLYPEAYISGTVANPANGSWPCAVNNPMCGYYWSLIISNNPPARLES